ncbi:Gamma-aminobutyrate:alpha-ketoglutarate aminotransferase [Klebsiella michiganensis]|uniref:Gamma-aminobutyrate:alpha-ketoglutarate aminotransferase n=1 Tax=Klebsiella michiganensis TaxID=1134687 RepID=A0A7H4PG94_9ENTR|nr:Gamma-aminobutyrate:alpha-ketoglutarate aminotransferase [Klebsiella michiganensis]
MKSSELNQRRQQATPRGVGVMCSYFVEKAENATLWDIEGNEVIDFAAGIAVLNTGHRHPKIVAAVEQQLQAFNPHGLPDCPVRKLCHAGRAD